MPAGLCYVSTCTTGSQTALGVAEVGAVEMGARALGAAVAKNSWANRQPLQVSSHPTGFGSYRARRVLPHCAHADPRFLTL
jgi:hypothetical protein